MVVVVVVVVGCGVEVVVEVVAHQKRVDLRATSKRRKNGLNGVQNQLGLLGAAVAKQGCCGVEQRLVRGLACTAHCTKLQYNLYYSNF